MFCARCGKGDQETDSYCRSCGEFLVDSSSRSSLIIRILGINNPDKQLSLTLAIDLLTAVISGFLLFSLMGYFDATEKVTGVPTSRLVYVLYAFLGLVCVWQLFSFTVGTTYKKKLRARRRAHLKSTEVVTSLPPANPADATPIAITEETTRNLERVARRE
jgi:uncharacterized membrane protein YuzA (DUF378 family)